MDYEVHDMGEDGIFRLYAGRFVKAWVLELDDGAEYGYIERIDVEPMQQGHGVGSSAIREIAGDFRRIFAAPDNEGAARLYARLGEKVVGEDVRAAAPLECLYYLDQGYGVYEVTA